MATLKNTTLNTTGFINLPAGTTAQRPGSPEEGMIRFNTTLNYVEYYTGASWQKLSISDPYAKATGGTEIDSYIGGIHYRSHIFNYKTFEYISNLNASNRGWVTGPADVKGERDAQTACSGLLDFADALAFAHAIGGRLPTRDEVERGAANGTGCGYDSQLVWTCEKSSEDASAHFVVRGNPTSYNSETESRNNSSTAYVSYVADVDLNRADPVKLSDPVIYDFLVANYPAHLNDVHRELVVTKTGEIDLLVVGGGGGGGSMDGGSGAAGGGGGAGGVVIRNETITSGTYTATVGRGGANRISGGSNQRAETGVDSQLGTIVALGGGAGGTRDVAGQDGGSGGGSNQGTVRNGLQSSSGSGGFGNSSGSATNPVSPSAGSGGGGAGDAGGSGFNSQYGGGRGGAGLKTDISGISMFYGGGGAGGNGQSPWSARGGYGGGGDGGDPWDGGSSRSYNGYPAGWGTGGGGGGCAGDAVYNTSQGTARGGTGASGIIVARYQKDEEDTAGFREVTDGLVFKVDAGDPESYNGRDYWRSTVGNGIAKFDVLPTVRFPGTNIAAILWNSGQRAQAGMIENWDDGITAEAWLYNGGGDYRGVVNNGTSDNTDRTGGFDLRFGRENHYGQANDGTNLNWRITNAGGTSVGMSFYCDRNVWTQVVGTYDVATNTMRVYKNGLLFDANTGTGTRTGPSGAPKNVGNGITIGRSGSTDEYLSKGTSNAPLSIVKLYNRALSGSEILQNFNFARWRFGI